MIMCRALDAFFKLHVLSYKIVEHFVSCVTLSRSSSGSAGAACGYGSTAAVLSSAESAAVACGYGSTYASDRAPGSHSWPVGTDPIEAFDLAPGPQS